jgi:ribosomal protein L11 methylase PrmA
MANILRGPLLDLQPRLTAYCRPGGRLLLSGILQAQVRRETAEVCCGGLCGCSARWLRGQGGHI